MSNRIIPTLTAALGCVLPAVAQDYDVAVEPGNGLLTFLVSLLPYVLLGLLICLALWFVSRMKRIERKYDRVIELLERLGAERNRPLNKEASADVEDAAAEECRRGK